MDKSASAIAINVSVFLLMIGVGLIVAFLPLRIMKLSVTVSDVGLLASAYAIPNILFQIPIGKLSDRFGFKSFIIAGYLLCGLTGFLYFFANTPNLYYGGRFLQGIAEVPIWALAPALLSIQYASDKGKFMGIYNASLHCGLMGGGLLSILTFSIWQGNEPFLAFAVLSLSGGVIITIWVENPSQESIVRTATLGAEEIWSLFINRTNLLILSGITLYGACYGIFITIIPAFLISAKKADQTMIGFFFMLFYIALSLSQLFAGRWSDRKGRKPAMITGLLLAAFGIATFSKGHFPLVLLFLTLASLGLGIFCVSSMAFLNERVSKALKGTISGAFYFSWGTGYFLGPLLMGLVGSSLNFQTGFMLFSGLILAQFAAISIFVQSRAAVLTENKSVIDPIE